MAISEKMLEELNKLLGLQDVAIADDELLQAGLAITNFVLVKQMKELQGTTRSYSRCVNLITTCTQSGQEA